MEYKELLDILKARFEDNMIRHKDMKWEKILNRLEGNNEKLKSLLEMERTGGEPDVVNFDESTGEYIFYDCAKESPIGRRNCCYDRKGQDERIKKGIFPDGNAIEMAADMGIEVLDEEQYRYLQSIDDFDLKTSTWLKTPDEIRKLGGAIFGDKRYNNVFIYHNGAQSFYSSRGFRGLLRVWKE